MYVLACVISCTPQDRESSFMARKFKGSATERREAWMLFMSHNGNMDKCELVLSRRIELIAKMRGPHCVASFLRFCQLFVCVHICAC